MNKVIKGIFIDTKNKLIKEVEIEKENFLEDCYKLIGCRMVECVGGIPNEQHDLWVDEEGWFNEDNDFFTIEGYPQPIRGNGIILGIDRDSFESSSSKVSVYDIVERVLFCNKESVLHHFH